MSRLFFDRRSDYRLYGGSKRGSAGEEDVRLFQVYKLSGGRRSFVARVAVPSREDVARALPPLSDEETYESAVECTDPIEYRRAIENYEEQIVREHLPEKRSELREIVTGLRNTVAMMDQIDGR